MTYTPRHSCLSVCPFIKPLLASDWWNSDVLSTPQLSVPSSSLLLPVTGGTVTYTPRHATAVCPFIKPLLASDWWNSDVHSTPQLSVPSTCLFLPVKLIIAYRVPRTTKAKSGPFLASDWWNSDVHSTPQLSVPSSSLLPVTGGTVTYTPLHATARQ